MGGNICLDSVWVQNGVDMDARRGGGATTANKLDEDYCLHVGIRSPIRHLRRTLAATFSPTLMPRLRRVKTVEGVLAEAVGHLQTVEEELDIVRPCSYPALLPVLLPTSAKAVWHR